MDELLTAPVSLLALLVASVAMAAWLSNFLAKASASKVMESGRVRRKKKPLR